LLRGEEAIGGGEIEEILEHEFGVGDAGGETELVELEEFGEVAGLIRACGGRHGLNRRHE